MGYQLLRIEQELKVGMSVKESVNVATLVLILLELHYVSSAPSPSLIPHNSTRYSEFNENWLSACGAADDRCSSPVGNWPSRVAIRLTEGGRDELSFTLSVVAVLPADPNQHPTTFKAHIRFDVLHSGSLDDSQQRLVRISDASVEGQSPVTLTHMVLSSQSWVAVTVAPAVTAQHRAVSVTLQQAAADGRYSQNTSVRARLQDMEGHVEYGSSIAVSCGPVVRADALCLNEQPTTTVRSYNHIDIGHTEEVAIARAASEGSGAMPVPSPYVIWTVSVCGVLVLLVATLFTVWHCQRKKLSHRRNSYQHQIMKRQQLDLQQQRQFIDQRQSDVESFRQLDPAQQQQESSNSNNNQLPQMGHQLLTLQLQQQNISAAPSPTRKKPRTYVKSSRNGNNQFSDSSTISNPVTDDQRRCTQNKRLNNSVNDGNIERRLHKKDSEYSNVPVMSGTCSESSDRSSSPDRNSSEIYMGRLRDDGGITGPYWFHSSRTPDPQTAMKIFKV